jgi:hypothetical protein
LPHWPDIGEREKKRKSATIFQSYSFVPRLYSYGGKGNVLSEFLERLDKQERERDYLPLFGLVWEKGAYLTLKVREMRRRDEEREREGGKGSLWMILSFYDTE